MSSAAGVPVALVTVPETVTLALRVAIAGFTDVIATDIGGTTARALPGWPGSPGRAGPLPDAAAGAPARPAPARGGGGFAAGGRGAGGRPRGPVPPPRPRTRPGRRLRPGRLPRARPR